MPKAFWNDRLGKFNEKPSGLVAKVIVNSDGCSEGSIY